MSEQNWNEYAFFGGIDPEQRQGCDEIFALLYGAIYFKKTEEILVQGMMFNFGSNSSLSMCICDVRVRMWGKILCSKT